MIKIKYKDGFVAPADGAKRIAFLRRRFFGLKKIAAILYGREGKYKTLSGAEFRIFNFPLGKRLPTEIGAGGTVMQT